MFRAPDAWAVPVQPPAKLDCGFRPGSLDEKYVLDRQLGSGGFGVVRVARCKATSQEFACKSIKKQLDAPSISPAKQQQHLENIKREVLVLHKLRGTLNVVSLEEVVEDSSQVHIVMELCRGGELLQRIGKHHYSERTVASYMRAVLRTLAQCHHHRILHRDVKPGNFMLLGEAEDTPVKAIDFGLACFFDPKALPLRHLGLEGTPHFMAPENLSSEVWPASDVWAAGVMTYQLLSGRMPFDDWKNPRNPALSQLWKSILTEEPKFSGQAWAEVSEGAKDFIRKLLTRDVRQRPSALSALDHPWVLGKKTQRSEGRPLASTIVQRLQRYSAENAFKRTILDMIANELLLQHMRASRPASRQPSQALPAPPAETTPTAATDALDCMGPGHHSLGTGSAGCGPVERGGVTVAADAAPDVSTHVAAGAGVAGDREGGGGGDPHVVLDPEGPGEVAEAGPTRDGEGSSTASMVTTSPDREVAERMAAAQRLLQHQLQSQCASVHAASSWPAMLSRRHPSLAHPLPLSPSPSTQPPTQPQHGLPLPHNPGQLDGPPAGQLPGPSSSAPWAQGGREGDPGLHTQHLAGEGGAVPVGQGSGRGQEWWRRGGAGDGGRGGGGQGGGVEGQGGGGRGGGLRLTGSLELERRGGEGQPSPCAPAADAPLPSPPLAVLPPAPAPPWPAPAAAAATASSSLHPAGEEPDGSSSSPSLHSLPAGLSPSLRRGPGACEGSGHALQQYAFLLSACSSSLNCAKRQVLGGSKAAGSPGAAAWMGATPTGSPMAGASPRLGAAALGQGGVGLGRGTSLPGLGSKLGVAPVLEMSLPAGLPGSGLEVAEEAEAEGSLAHGGLKRLAAEADLQLPAAGGTTAGDKEASATQPYPAAMVRGYRDSHHDDPGSNPGRSAVCKPNGIAMSDSGQGGARSTVWASRLGQNLAASTGDLLRLVSSVQQQRLEHRKAARLGLDTSGRAGTHYRGGLVTVEEAQLEQASPETSRADLAAGPAQGPEGGGGGEGAGSDAATNKGAEAGAGAGPGVGGAGLLVPILSQAEQAAKAKPATGLPGPAPPSPLQPQGCGTSTGGISGLAAVAAAGEATTPLDLGPQLVSPHSPEEGLEEGGRGRGMYKALLSQAAAAAAAGGGGAGGGAGGAAGTREAGAASPTPTPPPPAAAAAKPSGVVTSSPAGGGEGDRLASGVPADDQAHSIASQLARLTSTPHKAVLAPARQGPATPAPAPAAAMPQAAALTSLLSPMLAEHKERLAAQAGLGPGAWPVTTGVVGAGAEPDHGSARVREALSPEEKAVRLAAARAAGVEVQGSNPDLAALGLAGSHSQASNGGVMLGTSPWPGGERGLGAAAGVGGEGAGWPGLLVPELPPLKPLQVTYSWTSQEGVEGGPGLPAGSPAGQATGSPSVQRCEGTVSKGSLYPVLGRLVGGATQLAEFEAVLKQLHYDTHSELSFTQISEGLKCLGYKLEPSEVEVLLREVSLGGDALTQGAFLASQVDWREFQANHREEWLACLRKAFEAMEHNAAGRVGADSIVALLRNKLPEDEVNLAVQETLMDTAMGHSDGLDFDAFERFLRFGSYQDLSGGSPASAGRCKGDSLAASLRRSEGGRTGMSRSLSIDLYDGRMDASERAGNAAAGLLSETPASVGVAPRKGVQESHAHAGPGFMPRLPTVADTEGL